MEILKNINYKMVELSQCYFTEKDNLRGVEPCTSNIVSINQFDRISDAFASLIMDIIENDPRKEQIKEEYKDKYNYVVGKFISFDKNTNIITTEIGFKIKILDVEKSKFLKERTKKVLNSLEKNEKK